MVKKQILILGSGRSAFSLIEYLSERAIDNNWEILVVDRSAIETIKALNSKVIKTSDGDLTDDNYRQELIKASDLVISMLPVRFHVMVAKDCITFGKNMVTASYVTPEMESLHEEAVNAGVTILNEVGLDPGIDHMSAMKVIQEIQESGAELLEFESFTGGLLAPEFENENPWKYKFTWNPRNVVLASAGGSVKFLDHGMYKYIPYNKVFRRSELITLEKYGRLKDTLIEIH